MDIHTHQNTPAQCLKEKAIDTAHRRIHTHTHTHTHTDTHTPYNEQNIKEREKVEKRKESE